MLVLVVGVILMIVLMVSLDFWLFRMVDLEMIWLFILCLMRLMGVDVESFFFFRIVYVMLSIYGMGLMFVGWFVMVMRKFFDVRCVVSCL